MKELLIIYPHDSTTSFLLDSFFTLQKKIKSATFFEVHPNDLSHEACVDLITKFNNIVFMGHGSSHKLSGAKSESYNRNYLISSNEIKLLQEKNWLLFSCNSNNLLKACSSTVKNGIGFGDLPTDYNDILGIREFEANAYKNMNEDIINGFKSSINFIICESISYLAEKKVGYRDLFCFLKLLITKTILRILTNPNDINQREHSKLLFDMKQDMTFINTH